ncbi:MAG: hypothetical protein HYV27_21325 [Candidatus Hydrogenedentes bacterium]|nr:hypothetical protein [Candidatus Hydrogenedentota bacterium]
MPAAWITALRWHSRQHRWDILCVAVLFLAGALAGGIYTATWGGQAEFEQPWFGPAAMEACGRGFVNPKLSQAPELQAFLYGERDACSCASLAEDIEVLPRAHAHMDYGTVQKFHPQAQFPGWTQWQDHHRYLLFTVSFFWRVFGVAWSSLAPLSGLLYGISCVAVYGICRLAMRPPFALAAGMLMLTSPLHLQTAPHLLDYSKAPFLLGSVFLLGLVLRCEGSVRRYLALGLAAGIWMGVGLGFHPALLIVIALFGLFAMALAPGQFYETASLKLLLTICFGVGVVATGWPIGLAYYRANNAPLDALLGFAHTFDERLGVASPIYDFGGPGKDEYVRATLEASAYQAHSVNAPLRDYSPACNDAGMAYLKRMVEYFPADLATRSIASILRSADELQVSTSPPAPEGISHAILVRLFTARNAALDALPGYGRYYIATAILLIGAYNFQMGLGALVLWLVLAGLPALHFTPRNAFLLESISIFALLFLLHWLWRAGSWLWERWHFRSLPTPLPWKGPVLRAALLALLVAGGIFPALYGLRLVQASRVFGLLTKYDTAMRLPLPFEVGEGNSGRSKLTLPHFESPAAHRVDRPMQLEYLALEFAPMNAPGELVLRYESEHPGYDFSRRIRVPASASGGENTWLFVPVHFNEQARFQGIEMSPEAATALHSVARVDRPEEFPVCLTVFLTPGWQNLAPYQRLTR